MGELVQLFGERAPRDAASDPRPWHLPMWRRAGDLRELEPLTFTPDYPKGAYGWTAWRMAVRNWENCLHNAQTLDRALGDDIPAEIALAMRRQDAAKVDAAAVRLFKEASPSREDFRNKLRLLAACMGVREPGTIHVLDLLGRGPNPALMYEKLLCALYDSETPAPLRLRQTKREGA